MARSMAVDCERYRTAPSNAGALNIFQRRAALFLPMALAAVGPVVRTFRQ
ncbi:MAG: hypothetical protein J7494_13115 [Sphingobium sp.]|nr:hypothetical protein [Sphingobium sp.]